MSDIGQVMAFVGAGMAVVGAVISLAAGNLELGLLFAVAGLVSSLHLRPPS